jgi:hypothetical protein
MRSTCPLGQNHAVLRLLKEMKKNEHNEKSRVAAAADL